MGTQLVVFVAPLFDNHTSFFQAAKQFAVEALVAQYVMEGFDIGILARRAKKGQSNDS